MASSTRTRSGSTASSSGEGYEDRSPVGPALSATFGSLDRVRATKGLFVTTSTFTASARDTAEMLSKRIVLIDGVKFARLMLGHSVGCRTEETLVIKPVDEDFFDVRR